MSDDGALYMWTIYDSPSDYGPGVFVARKWVIDRLGNRPSDDVLTDTSLNRIRAEMLARGLTRLHRHEQDDAKIVETWV